MKVLVRPHEISVERVGQRVGAGGGAWQAEVKAVRMLGPIVRLELLPDGGEQLLEAEISRERYEQERFVAGERVGLSLRRFEVYAADAA